MDQHLISYYIGISIIILSHSYMLYKPDQPLMSSMYHAILNIIAALLIAYYFMFKETMITW